MGRLFALTLVTFLSTDRQHVLSQQCPVNAAANIDLGIPQAPRCGKGCVPIELEPEDMCIYDVSECQSLQSGELCKVHCKTPFEGSSLDAVCPVSGTGSSDTFSPVWQKPSCEPKCPDPEPMTKGYKRWMGTWACNGTWLGTPKEICHAFPNCSVKMELQGCAPPAPCVLEPALRCAFKFDKDCSEIWPTETCQASCRHPFVGSGTSTLSCPAGNTNSSRRVDVSPWPTSCTLTCDPPHVLPAGYVENATTGDYMCDDGYGGEASYACAIQDDCKSYMVFSGCSPIRPCVAPLYEGCDLDYSDCRTVEAGGSCQVKCKYPYSGDPVTATCPSDNTDAERLVSGAQPKCGVLCSTLYNVSDGYVSYPYQFREKKWQCFVGWAGATTVNCSVDENCYPLLDLQGCKPKVPCEPPVISIVERCFYDILDCLSVKAGATCEVKCREPYTGTPTVATCPNDNTDGSTMLTWMKPTCFLECPVPDPLPEGYVFFKGNWRCAEGFIGNALENCFTDGNCFRHLELTGCMKLQPCIVPANAPCHIDWSDCTKKYVAPHGEIVQGVWPGDYCWARCLSPNFYGEPVIANCTVDNTDPTTELTYYDSEPTCSKVCLEPDPVPGYVKYDWQCIEGYARDDSLVRPSRKADTSCDARGEDCIASLELSRCEQLVPCVAPAVHTCKVEFVGCESVPPGGSCEVRCSAPYEGKALTAYCPGGNTNPAQEIFWIEPDCQVECPDPDPTPIAYRKDETCGWQCDYGSIGNPRLSCFTDQFCNRYLELKGCSPLTSCSALSLAGNDTCRLNVTDCEGVMPGETCEVTCKDPYLFNSTLAECNRFNTDPDQAPELLSDLDCELVCPDPPIIPQGYQKNESLGGWLCAEGYIGTAHSWCTLNATCHPNVQLAGCIEVIGCKLPAEILTADPCMYDLSECTSSDTVASGTINCAIKCSWPYLGPEGQATCPSNNVDENGLVFTLPDPACNLGCGESSGAEGYVKIAGVWYCEEGYTSAGSALRSDCVTLPGCIVHAQLSGCTKKEPCKTLTYQDERFGLTTAEQTVAQCQYFIDLCSGIDPSETCRIDCKFPFVGDGTEAVCPAHNTDAETPVFFYRPTCRCPWVVKEGYYKTPPPENKWECAEGWTGTVVDTCIINPDCSHELELTGCQEVSQCESHWDFNRDDARCRVNATDCQEVARGASCAVKCSPPFYGNVTWAHCPADNTLRYTGLLIDPFECLIDCPDPDPIPAKYERGTWTCAPGYIGNASVYCAWGRNGDNCTSSNVFEGCKQLVPCVLPQTTKEKERCRLDFSACENLMPGSFCKVKCKAPYSAGETTAMCPPGNTDPHRELMWTDPHCDYDPTYCKALQPGDVKPGYYRSQTCGWQCLPGYTGTAKVEFITAFKGNDRMCTCEEEMTGCLEKKPCKVPIYNPDPCQFDTSDCRQPTPAGEECAIKCKSPYSFNVSYASCPDTNTDSTTPLIWDEHECPIECPVPPQLPIGYAYDGDGNYLCAPGYAGWIEVECKVDNQCKPNLELKNCFPIQPCMVPVEFKSDPCQFDLSPACLNLSAGQTCKALCKEPYRGDAVAATCPSTNIEKNYAVPRVVPQCGLHCPVPEVLPPGYTSYPINGTNGSVGFECAPGYIGNASTVCELQPGCAAPLQFIGCEKLMPCQTPLIDEADNCKFDISACLEVKPGEMCTVRCKPPYVGPDVIAACPESNTDPLRELYPSTFSHCIFQCPANQPVIHVPEGAYVLEDRPEPENSSSSSWECAVGYIGMPELDCVTNASDCSTQKELVGCKALVPCAVPTVPSCKVNTSSCTGVQPGSTCNMTCKAPYVGSGVVGTCAAGNTDVGRLLVLSSQPQCSCQVPAEPTGYNLTGNIWTCASGYTGNVSAHCVEHPNCTYSWNITGCIKTVPCLPPAEMFAARPGQCLSIQPGQTCIARCLPTTCVAGGPLRLHCPLTNIDPTTVAELSGQCRLRCEICSLGSFWDIDSRSGYISGNLPFGPANAEGGVLTSGIQGFLVYIATDCNERIGGPVAFVNSDASDPRACCMPDLYMAVLDGVAVPPNGSKLLVTINTTMAGELPLGVVTDLVDRTFNFTQSPGGVLDTVQQQQQQQGFAKRTCHWQAWHIVAQIATIVSVMAI